MSADLSEEEMRRALFGSSIQSDSLPPSKPEPAIVSEQRSSSKARVVGKPLSPKLRVTLHATREFEGDIEVFTFDANTLSTFVAEQEAKSAAKKKRFKYFDVVSINPI